MEEHFNENVIRYYHQQAENSYEFQIDEDENDFPHNPNTLWRQEFIEGYVDRCLGLDNEENAPPNGWAADSYQVGYEQAGADIADGITERTYLDIEQMPVRPIGPAIPARKNGGLINSFGYKKQHRKNWL